MEGLLKQAAGLHPGVSDAVGVEWEPEFALLINSQVILILLVQEPHFEKHGFSG